MMAGDILSGQQAAWTLVKKLGEGDAGEVYLVESLEDQRRAILKRPVRSAFPGDVARQSSQIATEGRILAALKPLFDSQPAAGISVPALLDQSTRGSERSEGLFIVIEQAPGLDLTSLARPAALGLGSRASLAAQLSPEEQHFFQILSAYGSLPERILLLCLTRLIDALEQIHTYSFDAAGNQKSGILWNDVKPDHMFWDVSRSCLTIIDWGNGQFLEADGATADRQYSILDDYRQFIEEMGRFLSVAAPDLKQRLEWPDRFSPASAGVEIMAALKEKLAAALQESGQALTAARRAEAAVLQGSSGDTDNLLEQVEEAQRQIIALGELPDTAGALAFSQAQAARLVQDEKFDTLRSMSDWAARLPGASPDAWRIVSRVAQITGRSEGAPRQRLLDALQAAISADWESVLWELLAAIQGVPEPEWWYDLSTTVRRQQLALEVEATTPIVSAKRVLMTLQSIARQIEDRIASRGASPAGQPALDQQLETINALIARLKEEILPNWLRIDPTPPHASLAYSDIDPFLDEIAAILPEAQQAMQRALAQPRAQVSRVQEAWSTKDFAGVGKGLRRLLLWDPDRRRILRADHAALMANNWLQKVQQGPRRGETLLDFSTGMEFEGRDLRNTLGPAPWLDLVLEGCKRLRRGVWPADLALYSPEFVTEMPWIKKFERGDRASVSQNGGDAIHEGATFTGLQEGGLGKDQDILLQEPLDTWVAEARGSSARVYQGALRSPHGRPRQAAIKLMRMDKIEYSLPLFREEVRVLSVLDGVPGVTRMLECGFILLDEGSILPSETDHASARALTGSALRMGLDQAENFVSLLESKVEEGWTPYVALEKRSQKDNLLRFCDAGTTRGRFLPLTDLLRMSVQICEILQTAHDRNIVYRDHKILHYYWQADANGIYVIDWNVARLHLDGLSDVEKQMDLVQFGARALHHILTGRVAPGALPMGPTRPEEIEAAAPSYAVQWTYDDQRLSPELKTVLERVLAGAYTSAASLGDDLKQTYLQVSNGNPNEPLVTQARAS